MERAIFTPAKNASEAILDAAEAAFSEKGLHGVGMKAIAQRAGVAQGLIHYHFQTKDGLYEAVVARRATLITARRGEMLAAIDLDGPGAVLQIFTAFFTPPLQPEGGGTVFAGIFGRLSVADAQHQELVRRYYDASAREFVAALKRARPDADEETCAWGYTMAIGVLGIAVGGTSRAARLAGHETPEAETTQGLIARLARHATGGFNALCDAKGV